MAERPLTDDELAVIQFVATAVGATDVCMQAEHARVLASRDRGGIWLDLEVPTDIASRHGTLTGHLPVEGHIFSVVNEDGVPRGGVLLWLDAGLLTALEVYDWGTAADADVPLPRVGDLIFQSSSHSR